MKNYDVVLLNESKWINPTIQDDYTHNVLLEDEIIGKELEKLGLRIKRVAWDDQDFDWSSTKTVLVRAVWDWFTRYHEFITWVKITATETTFINSAKLIDWNVHKLYLKELELEEIEIPPSVFTISGDPRSLRFFAEARNWKEIVYKPCISATAHNTYRVKEIDFEAKNEAYQVLAQHNHMLIQEFIPSIETRGEASLVVIDGKYTHAVLKRAKQGDFRVQDDFGGTVEHYKPTKKEIEFAEHAVSKVEGNPIYARVDIVWNEKNEPMLGELELIEPELWFRFNPVAAALLAKAVLSKTTLL